MNRTQSISIREFISKGTEWFTQKNHILFICAAKSKRNQERAQEDAEMQSMNPGIVQSSSVFYK